MQWKFPLVPELVNAIISLDSLRSSEGALTSIALQEVSSGGASNPIATSKKGGSQIGYKIFTYGADETLIIYREEDAFRVDLLRPYHTAQVSPSTHIYTLTMSMSLLYVKVELFMILFNMF
jgi:hypothetical protein